MTKNFGVRNDEVRKKDLEKAFEYFHLAAQQGIDNAQFNIGFLYHYGQGVKQNYEEAARWYEKAMAQGKEDATFKLSLITPKLHESGVSCE